LQRLKNEHVECSLQQLNPVLILVFFAHSCSHSTPNGVDRLLHFVRRSEQLCPLSSFKGSSGLRTTIGDSALARNRRATHPRRGHRRPIAVTWLYNGLPVEVCSLLTPLPRCCKTGLHLKLNLPRRDRKLQQRPLFVKARNVRNPSPRFPLFGSTSC
jgi:hypothetical protein